MCQDDAGQGSESEIGDVEQKAGERSDTCLPTCTRRWVLVCRAFILVTAAALSGGLRVLHLSFGASVGSTVHSALWGGVLVNCVGTACFWCGAAFLGPRPKDAWNDIKLGLKEEPWVSLTFFTGIFGAITLAIGVSVPRLIGWGMYVVIMVASQISVSMVVESRGFCWMPKRSQTVVSVIGCVLLMTGTVLFVVESLISLSSSLKRSFWLLVFPAIAGFANIMNVTGNKRLSSLLKSPCRALGISLALSTGLGAIAAKVVTPHPQFHLLREEGKIWQVFGGFSGVMVMLLSVVLPGLIGLAVTLSGAVFGQLFASLMVDYFGMLGTPEVPATVSRICGVTIVVVGVVLIRCHRQLSNCWRRKTILVDVESFAMIGSDCSATSSVIFEIPKRSRRESKPTPRKIVE